ncbi:hypothetical protein MKEN_01229000 [Mycena kentingensis (nom. inval.)]|nr:hypothetical protein MKEN_01229000 [Mycena kentingensis (nom. inval.)]
MLLTIDNTDTRLQYSPGWFVPGSYNTSTGQSGTLSSANGDVSVTFIFPVVATEFHYYAIQRCCGGWYGICFDADCDPNAAVFATIDGVNRTANGDNLPEAMYTRNFGETGIHTVTLKNMADSRFGGNSQITLDSFGGIFHDHGSSYVNPARIVLAANELATLEHQPWRAHLDFTGLNDIDPFVVGYSFGCIKPAYRCFISSQHDTQF